MLYCVVSRLFFFHVSSNSIQFNSIQSNPIQTKPNQSNAAPMFRSTPKRCSCGNLILKVPGKHPSSSSSSGRSLPRASTPRDKRKSVFERLYDTQKTYEDNRRKRAEELTELEAKECIYIPRTNHFKESMQTSASLSALEDRERKVDRAREQYHAGKLCDDCYKSIEVGTGATSLEAMVSDTESDRGVVGTVGREGCIVCHWRAVGSAVDRKWE